MVGLKVSQRGLLPLGEAIAKGSHCVVRVSRQTRMWRGLPHERLALPLGDKKLITLTGNCYCAFPIVYFGYEFKGEEETLHVTYAQTYMRSKEGDRIVTKNW